LCSIVAGFISSLLVAPYKWYGFTLAVLLFLPNYIGLYLACRSSYTHIKQSIDKMYFVSLFLTYFVGWVLFPVVWIFGAEGLKWLSYQDDFVLDALLGIYTKDVTEFLVYLILYKEAKRSRNLIQFSMTNSTMCSLQKPTQMERVVHVAREVISNGAAVARRLSYGRDITQAADIRGSHETVTVRNLSMSRDAAHSTGMLTSTETITQRKPALNRDVIHSGKLEASSEESDSPRNSRVEQKA
jgi:hypothetical protein